MVITIYTTKITNRVKYVTSFLFEQLLEVEVLLTNDHHQFEQAGVPKLNYSSHFSSEAVNIIPATFLFNKGVSEVEPMIGNWEDLKTLFPTENTDVPFDIFSAIFFLITRYEEYAEGKRDHYDRFLPEESIAYKHDFLNIPIVDLWVFKLRELIVLKFPGVKFPEREFQVLSTIDVDNAYAYLEKGFVRTVGALARSLFLLDFEDLASRIKCLLGMQTDPFDTFDIQLAIQKRYSFKTIYFFLVADYGVNDKNVPVTSRKFQALIKHISDYAEIGVHPSFASNSEHQKLRVEIDRLASVVHKAVNKSRQHFLKFSLPTTYQNLIDNGITDDYTMGYASLPGFRAGTCASFYFYNLLNEEITNLKVHPFCIMEATFRHYMNVSPEEMIIQTTPIIEAVKSVNGTFCMLWHNDSLSEIDPWVGWSNVYEKIVEMAFKRD